MIHQYMMDAYPEGLREATYRAAVLTLGYEDLFGWGTTPGAALEELYPKLEAREAELKTRPTYFHLLAQALTEAAEMDLDFSKLPPR